MVDSEFLQLMKTTSGLLTILQMDEALAASCLARLDTNAVP